MMVREADGRRMPRAPGIARRSVLALAGAAVMGSALPACALTPDEAAALVYRMMGEMHAINLSGLSGAGAIRDLEGVLARYFDMPIIARSVLGFPWLSASIADKRAFAAALQGYLARKYGRVFLSLAAGELEVQSSSPVGSTFDVRFIARLPGEAPIEVVFLVSDGSGRSGRALVFNMIVEGINLRTTENTEINALVDRYGDSVGRLAQELRQLG